jgi:hypothetical protein
MAGDSDKELMEAVLRQFEGKIDYQKLAEDLGMKTAKVAAQRWTRFKKKLADGRALESPATKASKSSTTTPSKTPTGKGTDKGKQAKASTPKKRKTMSDNDDDEDELVLNKWEGEGGEEEMQGGPVRETPSRQPSARKSQVMSFEEESSETEHNRETEFDDPGNGSGYGEIDFENLRYF